MRLLGLSAPRSVTWQQQRAEEVIRCSDPETSAKGIVWTP